MGRAVDRLAEKVALAIQVKAYLKRSPTGHIEPVVAHERTGNPAAPPGITPLLPLGPPPAGAVAPTPAKAPTPARKAPEPRTAPSKLTPTPGRTQASSPGVFTKAGVRTRVQSVVDRMMKDLGGPKTKVTVVEDPAEWYQTWLDNRDPNVEHQVDGAAPDAFAVAGKAFVGPNAVRDLREAKGGLAGSHMVAHELAHTLSGIDTNMGLAAIVEEGAAETVAVAWLGQNLSEEFINAPYNERTMPNGDTAQGVDRITSDAVYQERVTETIMTALRHKGFDRVAVLADVRAALDGDRAFREEWFRENGEVVRYRADVRKAEVYNEETGGYDTPTEWAPDPAFQQMTERAREAGIDPTPYQRDMEQYTGFLEYAPGHEAEAARELEGWSRALLAWVTGPEPEVKLARTYVGPYLRPGDEGIERVRGYWRRYLGVPDLPEADRSRAREALQRVPTEGNVGEDEVPNWDNLSSGQPQTGPPGGVVLHDTKGGTGFFQRIANAYDDDGRLVSTAQVDIAKVPSGKLQPGQVKALYVATRPDARKQGYATKLYDAYRESGLDIIPAVGQTGVSDEGSSFTRAYLQRLAEVPPVEGGQVVHEKFGRDPILRHGGMGVDSTDRISISVPEAGDQPVRAIELGPFKPRTDEVARIEWGRGRPSETPYVTGVWVAPKYRRKRVGTWLWQQARAAEPTLTHAEPWQRTRSGKKFVAALEGGGNLPTGHGPYPALIRNQGDHVLQSHIEVPPAVTDWFTAHNMRLGLADDPTLPHNIFGMSKATYNPAMRQVSLWVPADGRKGWVNAALAHEVGHAIVMDEVYNRTGSRDRADATTEEQAWEAGKRWAAEVGLELDDDSGTLEDMALSILHQDEPHLLISKAPEAPIPNPKGYPSPRGPVHGIVWHGQSHAGTDIEAGKYGTYWTTNSKEDADFYNQSDEGSVVELELNLENAANEVDLAEAVKAVGARPEEIAENSPHSAEDDYPNDYIYVPRVREELKRRGFDGFRGWDVMTNYDIQAFVPFDLDKSLRKREASEGPLANLPVDETPHLLVSGATKEDLVAKLDEYEIRYSGTGYGSLLIVDDPKQYGREVAHLDFSVGADGGMNINSIYVDPEYRKKGIAVGMLAALHERFDRPLHHGSFISPQGAQLGFFMASHYPEWNKVWLGHDDRPRDPDTGRFPVVYWEPGDPITGVESTFSMPHPGREARVTAAKRAVARGVKGAPAPKPHPAPLKFEIKVGAQYFDGTAGAEKVEATDREGNVVGTLEVLRDRGSPLRILGVEVDENFRMQGVATEMLNRLHAKYPNDKVSHSVLNDQSRAWFATLPPEWNTTTDFRALRWREAHLRKERAQLLPTEAPAVSRFDPKQAAKYPAAWEELPDTVYHVAPAGLHDAIVKEGLQPKGHAWNFALSEMDRTEGGYWDPETQTYVGKGSDSFGWRPEAAYVFADPTMAAWFQRDKLGPSGAPMEVFAIDTAAIRALPPSERPDLIKDPEQIQQARSEEAELREFGGGEGIPDATPDEIFENLREAEEPETGDPQDQRQWAIAQVSPEFVRPVASYELKAQEDWDEDDWTEYQEDHPEPAEPHQRGEVFTTVAEAEDHVRERYGYADFTGMEDEDLPALSRVIDEVDRIADEFPQVENGTIPSAYGGGDEPWRFQGIGTIDVAPPNVREGPGGMLDSEGTVRAWGATRNTKGGPRIWLATGEAFRRGTGDMGQIGFTFERGPEECIVHEMGHVMQSITPGSERQWSYTVDRIWPWVPKSRRGPKVSISKDIAVYADRSFEGFASLFAVMNIRGGLERLTPSARRRVIAAVVEMNEAAAERLKGAKVV